MPQLIGLAGTLGSGKDLLAKILSSEFGFTHISTSDLVRQVAMEQRGSNERPILFEVATTCRQEFGGGYFVELGLDQPRPLVISGIRSLGEMNSLKNAGGVMVFVDAPLELRYSRMISRARDQEAQISLEDFKERETKELYSGPLDTDFNIKALGQQADIKLDNSSSIEEFHRAAIKSLRGHIAPNNQS